MSAAVEKPVAAEVAEAEYSRFVEAMGLVDKLDHDGLDEADLKSLNAAKRTILQAMERARLVVDEKGQLVYTPWSGGDPLTFYEPTGASLMAMDQKKEGHNVSKTMAVLSEMTKTNTARFAAMPMRDLAVCQAIQALFLG